MVDIPVAELRLVIGSNPETWKLLGTTGTLVASKAEDWFNKAARFTANFHGLPVRWNRVGETQGHIVNPGPLEGPYDD
jgi:hypothetical protein